MNPPAPSFRVHVDPTNPGQFFACCALHELSARLPGNADAQGWFEDGDFCLASRHNLSETLHAITRAEFLHLDASDSVTSPLFITEPFNLMLDWWKASDRQVAGLKIWAGRMSNFRIARAMQHAMRDTSFVTPNLLNIGKVALDPDNPPNKAEPFCFDARRGANIHSRDIGFSTDALTMKSIAFPAVELLCFIGLQRCLPVPVPMKNLPRHYDYFLWTDPVEVSLLFPAAVGLLPGSVGYRFESWFRTQGAKAWSFANPLACQSTV